MIQNLPEDQAQMIRLRLGKTRAEELAEEYEDVGLYYKRCIREMGAMEGNGKANRVPNKTQAWLEVMSKKGEEEPEFSHRYIEMAVESFGGWTKMIEEFRMTSIPKAKGRFQYAYQDILDGNGR